MIITPEILSTNKYHEDLVYGPAIERVMRTYYAVQKPQSRSAPRGMQTYTIASDRYEVHGWALLVLDGRNVHFTYCIISVGATPSEARDLAWERYNHMAIAACHIVRGTYST